MDQPTKKAKAYNAEASKKLADIVSDYYTSTYIEDARNALDNHADPNYKYDMGYTSRPLLLLAIKRNDLKMVELLVDYGANVNEDLFVNEQHQEPSEIPLVEAAKLKDDSILKYLVSKGADVNVWNQDTFIMTPLMTSVMYRLYSSAEFLLQSGADPNMTNEQSTFQQKYNALTMALYKNSVSIVELLFSHGMEVGVGDELDKIYFDLAENNVMLTDLLLQNGANINLIDIWHYISISADENQFETVQNLERMYPGIFRKKSIKTGNALATILYNSPKLFSYIINNKYYDTTSDINSHRISNMILEFKNNNSEEFEENQDDLLKILLQHADVPDVCFELKYLKGGGPCNHSVMYDHYAKNWGLGIELETELFRAPYIMNVARFKSEYQNERTAGLYGNWNVDGIPLSYITDTVNVRPRKDSPLNEPAREIFDKLEKRKSLSGISEPDWGIFGEYTEIITKVWQNQTVGLIMDQFTSYKRAMLAAINRSITEKDGVGRHDVSKWVGVLEYPKSGAEVVTGKLKRGENVYGRRGDEYIKVVHTGSVHINVTFPVVTRNELGQMTEFDQLIQLHVQKHLYIMRVLQWLGPLFVAVFGSASPLSVGDNGMYPESSARIFGQDYSKIWTTDLSGEGVSSSYLDTRQQTIPNGFLWYDGVDTLTDPQVQTKKDGAAWTNFKSGAEFRRDKVKGPLFGFEWRIIDYLPDEYLQNVIQCLILCADHALERPINNYQIILDEIMYDKFQHAKDVLPVKPFIQMAKEIFMEGWNTPIAYSLAKRYVDILDLSELAETFTQPITAYSLLSDIMNLLFERYGRVSQQQKKPNGKMCQIMLRKADGRYYQQFKLLNWNKKSWEHILSKDGFLNGSKKLLKTLEQKLKLGTRGTPKEIQTKEDLHNVMEKIPPLHSFLKEDLDDLWHYLKSINVV